MERKLKNNDNIILLLSYLDAIPAIIMIVDDDVKILDFNRFTTKTFGFSKDAVYMQRGGDVLHCINSTETPDGCGHAEDCKTCVIRNSVKKAFKQKSSTREHTVFTIKEKEKFTTVDFLVTTSPVKYNGKGRAVLILEDISELAQVRKLLPICSNCKNIRNDQDYWESVEGYMTSRTGFDFSHGICPECMKELYPDYVKD